MFWGLTSRCTSPATVTGPCGPRAWTGAECAYSSPDSISRKSATAAVASSGPLRVTALSRLPPSHNSITRKYVKPARPPEYPRTTLTCRRERQLLISRRTRASATPSGSSFGRTSLTARFAPVARSTAAWTVPVAPLPSSRPNSHARSSGASRISSVRSTSCPPVALHASRIQPAPCSIRCHAFSRHLHQYSSTS